MDPIEYFNYFKYVPTVEEFNLFSRGSSPTRSNPEQRVVTPENQKFLTGTLKRQKLSEQKLKSRLPIIQLLGRLPWVKFIGLSGSVAMENAHPEDDIDLFVITAHNRLWTARFALVFLTSILGIKRRIGQKTAPNKLCFNLFFNEADLMAPQHKQTLYVAHEVLQLKPLVNKEHTYERFLLANRWVTKIFPQAKAVMPKSCLAKLASPSSPSWLEKLLKFCQLWLIKRHQTTEIVTDTQLWFFPEDFEKKLKIHYS